jgi:hypothetical protein
MAVPQMPLVNTIRLALIVSPQLVQNRYHPDGPQRYALAIEQVQTVRYLFFFERWDSRLAPLRRFPGFSMINIFMINSFRSHSFSRMITGKQCRDGHGQLWIAFGRKRTTRHEWPGDDIRHASGGADRTDSDRI